MNSTLERLLGRLFRPVRSGDRRLACNDPRLRATPNTIRLASPAFADGASMPSRHAGRRAGDNISPPLAWTNLPPGTKELVLVMQDPDAPLPVPVVHMIIVGMSPDTSGFAEGSMNFSPGSPLHFGRGIFGHIGYAGPGPVRGHGPHRYVFQLFALSQRLTFIEPPNLKTLLAAMTGKVLALGRLTGLYERR